MSHLYSIAKLVDDNQPRRLPRLIATQVASAKGAVDYQIDINRPDLLLALKRSLNAQTALQAQLQRHHGLKYAISLNATYQTDVPVGSIYKTENTETDEQITITNYNQIMRAIQKSNGKMHNTVENIQNGPSGWRLTRINHIKTKTNAYDPLAGSLYVDLPPALKAKMAIINVQNTDNRCFEWAILSSQFPPTRDAERVSKYRSHRGTLERGDLTFPMKVDKISKFERLNPEYSINVFHYESGDIMPLRHTEQIKAKHVNLLFYKDHYCWIKNFSRFKGSNADSHKAAKYYCYKCLQKFGTQVLLLK